MKTKRRNLIGGGIMLIVALASGCERESKGPRVFNHPPATVGPPPDLSQFDPPPNAQSAPEVTQAPAEAKPEPPPITTTPPADASTELHPEVAGLVEMAKRGVGDEALLAYVEQNPLTHRMTPETIIYLNDIGISEAVVAMMIRQGDTEPVEKKGEPTNATKDPVATSPPPSAPAPPADAPPVVNNYYYGSLDPYGDWIYDSSHGWVWRPTVAMVDVSWRPYRQGGRWIYSDVGWYWHSYYSWGWAPFHYGRWHRSSLHGWYWVPGYTWSPAWVMWRRNDLYCGWAPLPPGCDYVYGVGYMWHGSRVSIGFHFGLGHSHFTYCDYGYLRHRRLHRHHVPDTDIAVIHNETTVVNNYVTENNNTIINNGIPPELVAKKTREPVEKMRVRELDLEMESIARVGQIDANGKTMAVYRPKVPTPRDTPGEKPSNRTPITKTPSPGESTASKPDKEEADQKLLERYGNSKSLANRSKISGSFPPGSINRPLVSSYTQPKGSRPVAASPNRSSATKSNRNLSKAVKPSTTDSRTLSASRGTLANSRSKPSKTTSQNRSNRYSPKLNVSRKPGVSTNSRLLQPSPNSATKPNRKWQLRPSPSYSTPRTSLRPSTPKSINSPSRTPTSRSAPAYKSPIRSYSTPSSSRNTPPQSTRSAPSRTYRPPTSTRSAPSRSYRPPARSTPSRSLSAPSRSYSAPSRSFSAPSRSYSPPPSSPPSSSSSSSRSSSSSGSKNPR